MTPKSKVTILLAANTRDEFDTAARRIVEFGVEAQQLLPRLRIVIGSVDEDLIANLRRLPEVKAVEYEGIYQLDPSRNYSG